MDREVFKDWFLKMIGDSKQLERQAVEMFADHIGSHRDEIGVWILNAMHKIITRKGLNIVKLRLLEVGNGDKSTSIDSSRVRTKSSGAIYGTTICGGLFWTLLLLENIHKMKTKESTYSWILNLSNRILPSGFTTG